MALTVVRAHRWRTLAQDVADELATVGLGPFDQLNILVPSSGTGRTLRQDLAATAQFQLCAGLNFMTCEQWQLDLANVAGCIEPYRMWQPRQLRTIIWRELADLLGDPAFRVVEDFLSRGQDRALGLAGKLARSLWTYQWRTPGLLNDWSAGNDVDAEGNDLPDHQRWQPVLLRHLQDVIGVGPSQLSEQLLQAASAAVAPFGAICLGFVPTLQAKLMASSQETQPWNWWLPHWQQIPSELSPTNTRELADEPIVPEVEVHDSTGPARQAIVLRDRLCQLFQEDPTLEPRDVAIVVPDINEWASALDVAFQAPNHPARDLRVPAITPGRRENPVLRTLAAALALPANRATATAMLDLLTMPPIQQRWKLGTRSDLAELINTAEIRWGLDARQRASYGLADISQNTWTRGLDRLLVGIAVPPNTVALSVSGSDFATAGQLDQIGRLCEVISRLRRFVSLIAQPASAEQWVSRSREFIAQLCSDHWEFGGDLIAAATALADLAEDLSPNQADISRSQYLTLLDSAMAAIQPRPSYATGVISVVTPTELPGVDFRVLCLLGLTDPPVSDSMDQVELGQAPTDLELARRDLLQLSRNGHRIIATRRAQSESTGLPTAKPTILDWLFSQLGAEPNQTLHPVTSIDPANFSAFSFDHLDARVAAATLQTPAQDRTPPVDDRRKTATQLPFETTPTQLTLDELVRFWKDPASALLRSRLNISTFSGRKPSDELPVEASGLIRWSVRERLLTAAKQGIAPETSALEIARSEILPPGQLGRSVLSQELELVESLWSAASSDWDQEARPLKLSVALGPVQLRHHLVAGEHIVHVGTADVLESLLEPWFEVLLCAAAGVPKTAIVHALGRDRAGRFATCSRLAPPDQPTAARLLGWICYGALAGSTRLIPVPQPPALAMAKLLLRESAPSDVWDSTGYGSAWPFRKSHWELFFTGPPRELFDTPLQPGDPSPTNPNYGAFGAWSQQVYVPMLLAREADRAAF